MSKAKLVSMIGAAAAALAVSTVAYFEGTIRRTYVDPVGVLTSCTGHTGPELKMGQTFTQEQCDEQLYRDLLKHADDLDCITAPLTDGQKAALLSMAFNLGRKQLCGSTLVKKLNMRDYKGAAEEFDRWVYAGGKRLPGLVARRASERAMFEGNP